MEKLTKKDLKEIIQALRDQLKKLESTNKYEDRRTAVKLKKDLKKIIKKSSILSKINIPISKVDFFKRPQAQKEEFINQEETSELNGLSMASVGPTEETTSISASTEQEDQETIFEGLNEEDLNNIDLSDNLYIEDQQPELSEEVEPEPQEDQKQENKTTPEPPKKKRGRPAKNKK